MTSPSQLARMAEGGQLDERLAELYGGAPQEISAARRRVAGAARAFAARFGEEHGASLYSVPGRAELCGNHTDHQNGLVVAAAVNLDILAVAAGTGGNTARLFSEGFAGESAVNLAETEPQKREEGRSDALIRGVAAGVAQAGHAVGGFCAYTTSDVLPGGGLSSSAAFEVCVGTVLNGEYCGGALSPTEIAIIGRQAENRYFGKPSGLMDQLACAVGGAVLIDFEHPEQPRVQKASLDLDAWELALVITDTGGSHARLTDAYAAVRGDMQAVAAYFGKQVLREVPRGDFFAAVPRLRRAAGDRAVLRALHVYEDNRRSAELAAAVRAGSRGDFLRIIAESGHSSFEYNQNAYADVSGGEQGIPLALALSQTVMAGSGAARLSGGGFAGVIQAYVPTGLVPEYRRALEDVFGEGACRVLRVRDAGCTALLP